MPKSSTTYSSAGAMPLMLKLKKAQKEMMVRKAAHFLQVGHRNGSFGSSEGCGTKTTSVPFRWAWLVLKSVKASATRLVAFVAVDGRHKGHKMAWNTLTFDELDRTLARVEFVKGRELHV